MEDLPHRYPVTAHARVEGDVIVSSPGLSELRTAPPAQFGGRGDCWSPETLLVAAVADCFILSFRAVARASSLPWQELRCSAEGLLDRVEGTLRFREVRVRAELTVPEGTDEARARRLLEKAEKGCLVSNSLLASRHLETQVLRG